MEEIIGEVSAYFENLSVAAILLKSDLKVGDKIKVAGYRGDFSQTVDSMQIEHSQIEEAHAGQEVAIKVLERVAKGDVVYRLP